jgi:hypothetical protein
MQLSGRILLQSLVKTTKAESVAESEVPDFAAGRLWTAKGQRGREKLFAVTAGAKACSRQVFYFAHDSHFRAIA